MKKGKKHYYINLFIVALSVMIIGFAVSAQAHDGTTGSESSPYEFIDLTPLDTYHEDGDPFKGFFMLWTKNSTVNTWIGFNFSLSGSNVVFIDTDLYGDCSWAFDGDCDPRSSKGISSWDISTDQKSINVYFNNNWSPTQTGWVRVYTDNTDLQQNFTITSTPIVPEPVSSTLFLIGAAALGYRRFRNNF